MSLDKNEQEELDFLLSQKANQNSKFINYFQKDEIENSYFKDCNATMSYDRVYLYQDYQATRRVLEYSLASTTTSKLLDIASRLETALFFSHTCDVTYVESRDNSLLKELKANGEWCATTIPSFELKTSEAQSMPFEDNTYDIITCLHALEHFGLGRYGDELDYYGDQKGLKEFYRVLKPGGKLILSVPLGTKTKIEFNRQRTYHPDTIDCMLSDFGFEKEDDLVIMPFEAKLDDDNNDLTGVVYFDTKQLIGMLEDRSLTFSNNKIPNSVYFVTATKNKKENSK